MALTEKQKALEFYKCKQNPFYYIYNYVYIPESGGQVLYTKDKMHSKLRQSVRSIMRYHKAILMATRQLGKALALDTPIPQPDGKWTSMGELKVGDIILDSQGNPTTVTFATDIMHGHDCYEIEFDYHGKVVADKDHLWKVHNPLSLLNSSIVPTDELENYYKLYPSHPKYKDYNIKNIIKKDSVPVRCIQVDSPDHLFLCGEYIPTHNTTLAAAMLEWANNFYPNMRSIILTYSKAAAQEALDRIKFIHSNNPPFLGMKLKGRGDKKTYLEYAHGSVIRTFFTSGSTDPSKIGRAFSSPILYIDEAAHIRGIEEAYGAAQPILSTAREQAIKNNYPYFLLVTSTPKNPLGL